VLEIMTTPVPRWTVLCSPQTGNTAWAGYGVVTETCDPDAMQMVPSWPSRWCKPTAYYELPPGRGKVYFGR
jgi:hypothetical protein